MPHEPDIYDEDHIHCDVCGDAIDDGEEYYEGVEGLTLCQTCMDDWLWEHRRCD